MPIYQFKDVYDNCHIHTVQIVLRTQMHRQGTTYKHICHRCHRCTGHIPLFHHNLPVGYSYREVGKRIEEEWKEREKEKGGMGKG